jgi:hypothetical protein
MAQFIRPDGDDTLGNWRDQSNGTTNIYQSIDEVSASDADYIVCPGAVNDTYICTLSDAVDPKKSTGHVVRYRYRKEASGGNQRNLSVRLYTDAGATLLGAGNHIDIGSSWTDGSFTLSDVAADSITDYSDLELHFITDGVVAGPGSARRRVDVSWAEVEIPNVRRIFVTLIKK